MNEQEESPTADLVGDRLIVWDFENSRRIFKLGYFGKPVGIPKPKNSEFDAPLSLDLIEGLYLLRNGTIKVVRGKKNISSSSLERLADKLHEGFRMKYLVYDDLRRKQFVVTPGIKFGCDFGVYEHGPGIDHAPFLVSVTSDEAFMTAPDFVRAGRLATTVKKRFVFAVVNMARKEITYVVSKWWKA
jgi:tRNA-intron endonuclease